VADRRAGRGQSPDEQAAFAPFRPRRGRVVAYTAALVSLVLFGVIALVLPSPAQGGEWRAGDRVFFAAVGVAIAFLLWRFGSIRAVPTRESLTIRNLLVTRTVSWRDIAEVRFEGGDPWVTVELVDTETIAVMAVQKADAEFGRAEAGRLAALVQALGPTPPSPPMTADRRDD
jgi:MFS family permease